MKNVTVNTVVKCPFHKVVEGFTEELFRHLVQGFPPIFIERFDGLGEMDEAHLRLLHKSGPLWISVMSNFEQQDSVFQFKDNGKKLPLPLLSWLHIHRVEKVDAETSCIVDSINFSSIPGTELLVKQAITVDMKNRGPKYRSYYEQQ